MSRQVDTNIYDKGSLPPAGYAQTRSPNIKLVFEDGHDHRELKPLWREEHMEDRGTVPDIHRHVRHGQNRDMFTDNNIVHCPKSLTRWNHECDKYVEDKLNFRVPRFNPEQLPYAGLEKSISGSAALLINPPIAAMDVEEKHQLGHELYVRTHQDYQPGEQVDRNYKWYGKGGSDKMNRINGHVTGQRPDGALIKKDMTWENEMPGAPNNLITSSRYNQFTKTFQSEIGKVRDPNAETRHLNPDHTFGLKVFPQGYGGFESIYTRHSNNHPFGNTKEQGLVALVRFHVKRANHINFKHLQNAFDNFDRDKKGYLTAEDFRHGCWKFNIPIDDKLLFAVMRYCWLEEDQNPNEFHFETATLDMAQFMEHLTFGPLHEDICHFDTLGATGNEYLAKLGDYNRLMREHKSLAVRPNPTQHITTYSEIGAGADDWQLSRAWNKHGIPSVRSDKRRPLHQQLTNYENYGDKNMNEVLRPSTFTRCGINERDLMELRSKDEMKKLLVDSGPKLLPSTFDKAWPLAVKCSTPDTNNDDKASVKTFQVILAKISRVQLAEKASGLRIMRNFEEQREPLII